MKKLAIVLLAVLLVASIAACSAKENDLTSINDYMEPDYTGMQPITVYFPIGKAVLDEPELKHLDFYAGNIIEKANLEPGIEIMVMGSADSNTGTAKRNMHLSEARGEYVMKLLCEKYGIDINRMTVKTEIVKAKGNPAMDRAAVITFK